MKLLGNMEKGTRAEVICINGEGEVSSRLSALGFLPGKIIELIHVAPLQDPITLRMENQEISVRKADANFVEVVEC